jgi:hypothetical protein
MMMDITLFKDILNISLTAVLTVATVLLAIYTWRLVNETRIMRKDQVRPNITVYFDHAETDPTLIFIVVENNGRGTAYDLKFKITKAIKSYIKGDESDKLSNIGLFKYGMKHCPAGFKKRYFLMETTQNYKEKMAEELHLTLSYNDTFKEAIVEELQIPVKEMALYSKISPADTNVGRVAEHLAELNKNIKKWHEANAKGNN